MQAIKKINNNVALCIDGAGRQVIAMGKGIGFHTMPCEIPLENIDRTFYDIDESYAELFRQISPQLLRLCIRFVEHAQQVLPYPVSSTAALAMADHIQFAMERARKNIRMEFPLAFELKNQYPMEMELAEDFWRSLRQAQIHLSKSEIAGIAINLINAQLPQKSVAAAPDKQGFEGLLELVVQTTEDSLGVKIDRDTFNFSRFATHIYYLAQRLENRKPIDSENLSMYEKMCEGFPELQSCAERIAELMRERMGYPLQEEEKLYLMLHINRIVERQDEENNIL